MFNLSSGNNVLLFQELTCPFCHQEFGCGKWMQMHKCPKPKVRDTTNGAFLVLQFLFVEDNLSQEITIKNLIIILHIPERSFWPSQANCFFIQDLHVSSLAPGVGYNFAAEQHVAGANNLGEAYFGSWGC